MMFLLVEKYPAFLFVPITQQRNQFKHSSSGVKETPILLVYVPYQQAHTFKLHFVKKKNLESIFNPVVQKLW